MHWPLITCSHKPEALRGRQARRDRGGGGGVTRGGAGREESGSGEATSGPPRWQSGFNAVSGVTGGGQSGGGGGGGEATDGEDPRRQSGFTGALLQSGVATGRTAFSFLMGERDGCCLADRPHACPHSERTTCESRPAPDMCHSCHLRPLAHYICICVCVRESPSSAYVTDADRRRRDVC